MKSVLLVAASVATLMTSMAATAREAKPQFTEFEDGFVNPPTDVHVGSGGSSAPLFFTPSAPTSVVSSFEGASDYTTRALGIGLIPPDTMGAVGRTQYVELINGSFSVYNKATGLLAAPRVTDSTFWRAAGGTATGGDPRIQFDAQQNRWLAIGFGANNANLQVAVSATSDALGVWRAATFTGYPGLGFGATADYPTLAVSGNSILIGTNNFAPSTAGGSNSFRGTTLNILNKDQVFAAGGPILTSLKQINTPLDGVTDNGFAIQGVNRQGGSSTATVVASSLYAYDNVVYQVTNAGAPSGAQTASQYQAGGVSFESPNPGRQPVTGANARILATGDERTGTSAFDVNGRTYFAATVQEIGSDHAVVRVTVMNTATGAVLSQTDIGGGASNVFDYWEGSLAVNASGQVVVGYNRSGDVTTGVAGRASIFARSFNTNADGTLAATSGEILVKASLVDEYHNGSAFGLASVGRQRWGDYSTVTIDPTNDQRFWLIGEFAREYNNAAGGHPGGSGFGRWGTYIAQLGVATVPEPATWALMIGGFGFVGVAARRRRSGFASA